MENKDNLTPVKNVIEEFLELSKNFTIFNVPYSLERARARLEAKGYTFKD